MSGASIAAEVNAALASLAPEIGSGAFSIVLLRSVISEDTPWAARAKLNNPEAYPPEEFTLAGNVQEYARSLVDGTLIKQGDRRVMLSATGEKPTTSDSLRIGDREFQIINVMEIAPQGVPLYYEVQART